MNKTIILIAAAALMAPAAEAWEPVGGRIATEWAADVTPEKPWNVYPRPVMERTEWENLNGLWQYAIVPAAETEPEQW